MNMELSISSNEIICNGQPTRRGTMWTASAHIITAVIGSGVLSLAWAMAQLGWIIGTMTLVIFSLITMYTSNLLADCYRNSVGERNCTYISAIQSSLGKTQIWMCGLCQYANLCGTAIGYTITAAISASSIEKSYCFQKNGPEADCSVSYTMYMIAFGLVQILFSQLPNFHNLTWLSVVAAIMSFSYSIIGVSLAFAQTVSGRGGTTTITGTVVGLDVTSTEKIWNAFQAIGNIAFAFSYSMVLIEIQDTLKSPPAENKVMKKASIISVTTTTLFYLLCGCLGYSAFGNKAPGNMLTGFGSHEHFWLVDIANICIVIHLLGAYQVFSQPVYAFLEDSVKERWPETKILIKETTLISSKSFSVKINLFRLVWRSSFVVACTILAIIMPFFNDIIGLLGAIGFWPLAVYFPIEMYMVQKKIPKLSPKGIKLQMLNLFCLIVSIAAAIGSAEGIVVSLGKYKPFQAKF